MKSVVFAPSADRDLLEIGMFIARDNRVRAVTFIYEIEEFCRTLGDFPRRHAFDPACGPDVRAAPYAAYRVLYREHEDHVRIERVVHGARRLAPIA